MSNNNATFSQANHTLTLLNEIGLTEQQMVKMHDGYLPALARAAKEGRLPPLSDFNASLSEVKADDLCVVAKFASHDGLGSKANTLSLYESASLYIPDERLRETIHESFNLHEPAVDVEVVLATPAQLGADTALFKEVGFDHEARQRYVIRKGRERGLTPFTMGTLFRFTSEIEALFTGVCVTSLSLGSTLNQRNFLLLSKRTGPKTKIDRHAVVVTATEKLLFTRVRRL